MRAGDAEDALNSKIFQKLDEDLADLYVHSYLAAMRILNRKRKNKGIAP